MYLVNIRGRSHVAPDHRQVPRDVGTSCAGTPRGATLRRLVVLREGATRQWAAHGSWDPPPYPAARYRGAPAGRQRPRGSHRAGVMNGGGAPWPSTGSTSTTATTSTGRTASRASATPRRR